MGDFRRVDERARTQMNFAVHPVMHFLEQKRQPQGQFAE